MRKKPHAFSIILFLALALFLGNGCAALVAGTAAGAGVYTWMNGELIRSYPVPSDRAVDTVADVLDSLRMTVEETGRRATKTTFKAREADGGPIHVRVERLAPKITEIGVRSGIVGYWNRRTSELIHAEIAEKLSE